MATRLYMDLSGPNPHLYQGPSDRLPPDWSNDWENFLSRGCLFPLVNGRIFASLNIELHNHVYGEIYIIMYNRRSDNIVIRIGTRYFVYHFDTDVLLEFIHTYPTLDAFLDLARQWGGPLSQYQLTPFVEVKMDVTPDNYYDEVDRWDEELKRIRATHALMGYRLKGQRIICLTSRTPPLPRQLQKGIQRRIRVNGFQEDVRFEVVHETLAADPDDSFVGHTMTLEKIRPFTRGNRRLRDGKYPNRCSSLEEVGPRGLGTARGMGDGNERRFDPQAIAFKVFRDVHRSLWMSLPSLHYNGSPSDRRPPNWSNDWEDFPFRRRLFPLVNGQIFASLDIEHHNHVYGEIYFIMYNVRSEEAIIRISTRYFVYHFETDMLLEFIHTYPTLDAFLDLASQWDGPLCHAYTLTPFVQRETDVTPDNYYDEVERWDEELKMVRAAHASRSAPLNQVTYKHRGGYDIFRDLRLYFLRSAENVLFFVVEVTQEPHLDVRHKAWLRHIRQSPIVVLPLNLRPRRCSNWYPVTSSVSIMSVVILAQMTSYNLN
ncbi:hypothetical protein ARMGADRAFT_1023012 [Armillaria gallica]|uniref:Uncharacterized protein n=1 Tax=Armillaria gallica TaxID=47427 RepID=A0A2H3ED40_ARMGA|nr:hypothetical protein ARMGADRAFT_1023012 [Armillaria gallica]